jgi:hypothetical protein
VRPEYIAPVSERLLCCLPKGWRQKLYCGVAWDDLKLDENGHVLQDTEENIVKEGEGEGFSNNGYVSEQQSITRF